MRSKISERERIERMRLARERAKKNQESVKKELEEKSAFFRKGWGKAIRLGGIALFLLGATALFDSLIAPNFEKRTIQRAEETTINIIINRWWVPAKFYQCYLSEDESYSILMYKSEYEILNGNNEIEVGYSPVFHRTVAYRTIGQKEDSEQYWMYEKIVESNTFYVIVIPIMGMFFGLLAILIRPGMSFQTIFYSYANLVIIPFFLLTIGIQTIGSSGEKGDYEMDLTYLDLEPLSYDFRVWE